MKIRILIQLVIAAIAVLLIIYWPAISTGLNPEPESQLEADALGLRWGMSGRKVETIYPAAGTFVPKGGYGSRHGTVPLLGLDWALSTIAGYGGEGLKVVKLEYELEEDNRGEALKIYNKVLALLNQKYGKPLESFTDHAAWETPRTIVMLDLFRNKKIILLYSARPGYADLDKL